jgi:hypothetical protein
MNLALGVEMVVGIVLLFGGGAWMLSELESLGGRERQSGGFFFFLGAPMGIVALAIAAVGGFIVWNGINGGSLLLDPDRLRSWVPDRFN